MSALKDFQTQTTPLILQELKDFFDHEVELASKKDVVLENIVKVIREFSLRGGKRIRPLMTVLGYQMTSTFVQESGRKNTGNIYRAACAVETHHHYLLSIDDILDRDVVRHGAKTLHEYYRTEVFQDWEDSDHHGEGLAVIAGALLNSYTFSLLQSSGFPPEKVLRAIEIVTQMLFSDTVTGWQIQYFQNNEPVEEATEERFMKGLEFVTSRYTFIGPMLVGLVLALDEKDAHFSLLKQVYTDYGRHVGIAFQIQDDVLGLFGDPKETGKAVGNDVREGKKTLLMQYAFEHGDAAQKKVIKESLNSELSEVDLAAVQKVVKDTGSLAYSQKLAQQNVQDGVAVLKKLPIELRDSREVAVLKELAEYMIQRSH